MCCRPEDIGFAVCPKPRTRARFSAPALCAPRVCCAARARSRLPLEDDELLGGSIVCGDSPVLFLRHLAQLPLHAHDQILKLTLLRLVALGRLDALRIDLDHLALQRVVVVLQRLMLEPQLAVRHLKLA
eukprot:933046-Prymnesium_polylepis.2